MVAGRTTEPPGREILRGELRGHVWWAARTGGRGQCLGVGGTPHRPCPAVLCGSLDRWYRVTAALAMEGGGQGGGTVAECTLCPPGPKVYWNMDNGKPVYAGVKCEVKWRKQN
ncbi:g7345 [Coccomyxa elongata]